MKSALMTTRRHTDDDDDDDVRARAHKREYAPGDEFTYVCPVEFGGLL
jgi:hypothetical protein